MSGDVVFVDRWGKNRSSRVWHVVIAVGAEERSLCRKTGTWTMANYVPDPDDQCKVCARRVKAIDAERERFRRHHAAKETPNA